MRIIAGEARGKRLLSPKDRSIRPPLDRIRESIYSRLGDSFSGSSVLDLFAGAGSFGLEAVSRGARRTVFVEQSDASIALLKKNIRLLGFDSRCEIVKGDALTLPDLSAPEPRFALVFMDPPFRMFERAEDADRIFRRVDEILKGRALEKGAAVILRRPRKYRGAVPVQPAHERTFGESVVLSF